MPILLRVKQKRMPRKRLPKNQEKFIENMANPKFKSQTEAYQDAYGCDADSARKHAPRMVANGVILERIEERKREVAKHANVTAAQIIGATALRAFATIDDAFDENGDFSITKARETGAIHLIKKMSRKHTKEGIDVSVEFYSNESAQDKLGNYLGLEKAPQQFTPEISVALKNYRELVESGLSKEEALKQIVELMEKTGVKVTEDEILKAELVG